MHFLFSGCFHAIERMDENQRRRLCFFEFTRVAAPGAKSAVSRLPLVNVELSCDGRVVTVKRMKKKAKATKERVVHRQRFVYLLIYFLFTCITRTAPS